MLLINAHVILTLPPRHLAARSLRERNLRQAFPQRRVRHQVRHPTC